MNSLASSIGTLRNLAQELVSDIAHGEDSQTLHAEALDILIKITELQVVIAARTYSDPAHDATSETAFRAKTDDRPVKSRAPSETEEINKVARKLPKWARSQHQINAKILTLFLKIKRAGAEMITEDMLRERYGNESEFYRNWSQMKAIAPNNHGKVFDVRGGVVDVWEPVRTYVDQYEQTVFGGEGGRDSSSHGDRCVETSQTARTSSQGKCIDDVQDPKKKMTPDESVGSPTSQTTTEQSNASTPNFGFPSVLEHAAEQRSWEESRTKDMNLDDLQSQYIAMSYEELLNLERNAVLSTEVLQILNEVMESKQHGKRRMVTALEPACPPTASVATKDLDVADVANGVFWIVTAAILMFLLFTGWFDKSVHPDENIMSIIAFSVVLAGVFGGVAALIFLTSPAGSTIFVTGTVVASIWVAIFGHGLFGSLLFVGSWGTAWIFINYDSKHTGLRIWRGMWRTPSPPERAFGRNFDE